MKKLVKTPAFYSCFCGEYQQLGKPPKDFKCEMCRQKLRRIKNAK